MSTQQVQAVRLPRLLGGIPDQGHMRLGEHLEIHGELPTGHGRRHKRRDGAGLLESIEEAGLRGRGGAAFPAATKMRAVAKERRRAIVVANGAEGEPASLKDKLLLEALPHLVLDGGSLAVAAVGASELIVCVPRSANAARDSLTQALRERERERYDSVAVRVELMPDRYLAGQESALVSHLNRGPGVPTLTPPMPFERGVQKRPTLINNVETLAHIALIARYGSDWFRELGTPGEPGSTLLTLSGAIEYPGVYEIESGAPLGDLIEAAGGARSEIKALLLGGYSGTWLPGLLSHTLPLSAERLAPYSAGLGPGIVLALSGDACGVSETARVTRWLSEETAGQCGPCVQGLNAIASAVEELQAGTAASGTEQRIARWASMVQGRGACAHPDGAVRFVASALNVFAEEFAEHARHGPCPACARPSELPLPEHPRAAVAA
ncbi:MAG TPA: NADH-ubiquinone oxidoreductase-F iron-sulfur binding region domain-containing protein [Solirubrobacteraceae bacterium]